MSRQSLVTFGGNNEDGDLIFMSFNFGDPRAGDGLAGEAQRAAVEVFYGMSLDDDGTVVQAQRLLGIRDYARAVAVVVFPPFDYARSTMVARFIAAFISIDPEMSQDVYRWSRARWRNAADPDTIGSAVVRTKHFVAAEAFAVDAVADMRAAGAVSFR